MYNVSPIEYASYATPDSDYYTDIREFPTKEQWLELEKTSTAAVEGDSDNYGLIGYVTITVPYYNPPEH